MAKGSLFKAVVLVCIAATCTSLVEGQSPTPTPAAKPPGLPGTFTQPKVIEDPSVRSGWRRYQFSDDPVFSVILPGPPDTTVQGMPSGGAVNMYLSTLDTGIYAAVRITGLGVDMERASEAERQGYFKNFLEGFAKGFQESMKRNDQELKLLDPRKVTAAGREAFQQDFTVGSFQGSAQLVFSGAGAFCVLAVWSPQSPPANSAAFFNSFQLIGAPK